MKIINKLLILGTILIVCWVISNRQYLRKIAYPIETFFDSTYTIKITFQYTDHYLIIKNILNNLKDYIKIKYYESQTDSLTIDNYAPMYEKISNAPCLEGFKGSIREDEIEPFYADTSADADADAVAAAAATELAIKNINKLIPEDNIFIHYDLIKTHVEYKKDQKSKLKLPQLIDGFINPNSINNTDSIIIDNGKSIILVGINKVVSNGATYIYEEIKKTKNLVDSKAIVIRNLKLIFLMVYLMSLYNYISNLDNELIEKTNIAGYRYKVMAGPNFRDHSSTLHNAIRYIMSYFNNNLFYVGGVDKKFKFQLERTLYTDSTDSTSNITYFDIYSWLIKKVQEKEKNILTSDRTLQKIVLQHKSFVKTYKNDIRKIDRDSSSGFYGKLKKFLIEENFMVITF